MTEVLFYHLQNQSIEGVLPDLLERSLARGWRVVVQSSTPERVEALDAHLWTFRDDSFLPHGTSQDPAAADQPVVLTVADGNPNAATVRFLVDGAPLPQDCERYERIVLLFDGDDPDAAAAARESWTFAKGRGFDVTYWQRDNDGRWQRKN
jgi:DNA polymerase-3 subunit chi